MVSNTTDRIPFIFSRVARTLMAFEAAPQLEIPEHSSFHSLMVGTSSSVTAKTEVTGPATSAAARRAINSPLLAIRMG